MKTTELRIGNYVDVINRSHKVHLPFNTIKKVGSIDFFKVRLYQYDKPFALQPENWEVDTSDLSPIPLTVHWLEKFGFKVQQNGLWYLLEFSNEKTKGSFGVSYINGTIQIGDDVHTQAMKSCKYVHQLQNLYFSLSGKELE